MCKVRFLQKLRTLHNKGCKAQNYLVNINKNNATLIDSVCKFACMSLPHHNAVNAKLQKEVDTFNS